MSFFDWLFGGDAADAQAQPAATSPIMPQAQPAPAPELRDAAAAAPQPAAPPPGTMIAPNPAFAGVTGGPNNIYDPATNDLLNGPLGHAMNGPGSPMVLDPQVRADQQRAADYTHLAAAIHPALGLLARAIMGPGPTTDGYNASLGQATDVLLKQFGVPKAQLVSDGYLHPESLEDRAPAAPGIQSAATGNPADGAVSPLTYAQATNRGAENTTGNPNAKNPNSSATGDGQFIKSTWLSTIRRARPDLAAGKSDAELLAMRGDSKLSDEMTAAYGQENAVALKAKGIPATMTTLALLHQYGPGDGVKIIEAAPDTKMSDIVSADVIEANKLQGATARSVVLDKYQKMGGANGGMARVDYRDDGSPLIAQQGAAPPVQQQGAGSPILHNIKGVPLPAGITPRGYLFAQAVAPDATKAFYGAAAADKRPGSTGIDFNTGQQTQFPEAGMSRTPGQPGYNEELAQHTAAKAGAEQTAIGAREKDVQQAKIDADYQSQFGEPRPGSAAALAAGRAAAASPAGKPERDGSVVTEHGSVIPSVLKQAPLPQGSTERSKAIEKWADTTDAWSKSAPENFVAENRVQAIMEALKQVQSGTWATNKADFVAKLKAVGLDLSADTMKSVSAVQIALKDNFATALSNAKAFSNRATQLEVMQGSKNFANPDMQPEANHTIGAQAIGTLRHERDMMTDWRQAQTMGWKNPQDFELAWKSDPRNSLQTYIDKASKEIGPLKGEPNGEAAAPRLGATATGPNGAKLRFDGKKWNPM